MIRPVSCADFAYPILETDCSPCRPSGHIAEHERVIRRGLLWLEFRDQRAIEPTNPRLINRTRVVSNQARKPTIHALIPNPARAIKRMKTRLHQRRRITDIMQIGRCYEQVVIGRAYGICDPACLLADLPDVQPAVPEWGEQAFCLG